jgi:hypothetical protein
LLLILVAVTLLVFGLANGSTGLLISSIAASLLAAVALVIGARQAAARTGGGYPGTDEPDDEVIGATRRRWTRVSTGDGVDGGMRDYGAGRDYDADRTSEAGRGYHTEATYAEATYAEAAYAEAAYAEAAHDGRAGGATVDYDDVDDVPPDEAPPRIPVQAQGNGASSHHEPGGREPDHGDAEFDDEEDPPDEPPQQYVSPADAARVARLASEVLVIDGRPRYHLSGCVHLLGRESEPLPVAEAVELGFSPCSMCEPDSALLAGARRA